MKGRMKVTFVFRSLDAAQRNPGIVPESRIVSWIPLRCIQATKCKVHDIGAHHA